LCRSDPRQGYLPLLLSDPAGESLRRAAVLSAERKRSRRARHHRNWQFVQDWLPRIFHDLHGGAHAQQPGGAMTWRRRNQRAVHTCVLGRRLSARLDRDESGNVIVIFVAAALLLVAMLWALIGTGARLVQKETIQSSADAA